LKYVDIQKEYWLSESDANPYGPHWVMRHEDVPMLELLVWPEDTQLPAKTGDSARIAANAERTTEDRARNGDTATKGKIIAIFKA
jgi:hypothetical protein